MTQSTQVVSPLRLVKWCTQWQAKKDLAKVPIGVRGVYSLHDKKSQHYDVVYVGMSASIAGERARNGLFSMFVVWENIREEEIRELEALLRETYRKDSTANRLAKQKGSKRMREVRKQSPAKWPTT